MATGDSRTLQRPSSKACSKITQKRVQKVVSALLKWKTIQSESQTSYQDDDFMYLVIAFNKIPPRELITTNPHNIPLPHPLFHPESLSEICLIIDDRPKPKPNSKLTSEFAQKKIKSENIPITKTLKLSKLKSDYKSFESKRKLYETYDLFLADKRVFNLLPKILGKQFFKNKKKLPLPVDLGHPNWKDQVMFACSSGWLYLKPGTCSSLRIGRISVGKEEIVDNVFAAIDGVVGLVPKNWKGLRSLHLKCFESLALPLYDINAKQEEQ